MLTDEQVLELCNLIRETAFAIHTYLRHGHLEKIYERALENRLKKQNICVASQFPLTVYDADGTTLGDFFADLFVAQCLIVEVKACKNLADEHIAQLMGYLHAAKLRHGLIINFGAPHLQIKKIIL